MAKGRVAGMKKHRVRMQELTDPVREAEVFKDCVNLSDNFENLFEMPVFFYMASTVIYVTQAVDGIYLVACWLYVFLRVAHSYVHCTTNRVKYRFRIFGLSVVVLLLIWVRIAYQVLTV